MTPNAHTQQSLGLRHRIAEIKLEPVTHTYPIILKILVDDVVALRLPRVERNHPLHWKNIPPCNAISTSRLVLRVYEQRAFTKPCVGSVAYTVSDVADRLDTSLACDSRRFVVTFIFPTPKPHEEVAAEALSNVQGMQQRKTLLEKLGQTRAAIEKIQRLGSTVVQLLPATEAALAICGKAWEKLEAQQECDRSIETLVEGLSDIFPYAEAVKKAAKLPQLQKNILALLSLIEDASRFIVDYKMDGRAVQTLRSFAKSTAHEQVQEILKRLQELKEEFDRA
ncbi:hypothetical protein FS749_016512 [Ceratobasidium sp. UAMH 11750]|nr:hypothetical protein FS749_016512 [Ceratobasidium sp. UAMH 11750]